ncbi:hypothetical protein D9M71_424600 [compost metagenome]
MLAGQEQELGAVGRHHVEKDPHRGIGDAAELEFVLAHQADGLAKGFADFIDQGQAQLVHVGEMPVKAGRDDACGFRHFAQADAAEASTAFHQVAGGIQQGVAGLLLLFGARQHGKYRQAVKQPCTLIAWRQKNKARSMDRAGRGATTALVSLVVWHRLQLARWISIRRSEPPSATSKRAFRRSEPPSATL